LFLEDTNWIKPDNNKHQWIAKISNASKQLTEYTGYWYVLETRGYYLDNMSREQVIAVLYHELRHIDFGGELIPHDIEDWSNMVATLGAEWHSTETSITNILDDEFKGWNELRKAGKQISIYDNVVLMSKAEQTTGRD